MYNNLLIHSSANGHLGYFHVLAIVNSAAVNTGVHVSISILVSSGYMPSGGIAGSYGSFIPGCFFLSNLHTVQIISQFVWKHKRPWIAKAIMRRRMELEKSTFLTLDYTTKLQSSRQYGTATKTEI